MQLHRAFLQGEQGQPLGKGGCNSHANKSEPKVSNNHLSSRVWRGHLLRPRLAASRAGQAVSFQAVLKVERARLSSPDVVKQNPQRPCAREGTRSELNYGSKPSYGYLWSLRRDHRIPV